MRVLVLGSGVIGTCAAWYVAQDGHEVVVLDRQRGARRFRPARLHAARRATLEHVVTDLFPRAGDMRRAGFWTGLRPMTPDGPPVVGPTRYRNLHLATGHGTLGWTMAAGTGRVVADVIAGHAPGVSLDGLTLARYG